MAEKLTKAQNMELENYARAVRHSIYHAEKAELRVPPRVRKLFPETKMLLAEMLAAGKGFVKSCKALGFTPVAARNEMKRDPAFKALIDAARLEACEGLEESVYDRAAKNDTTAAIFMLKAMKPETYGDRLRVDATTRTEIVVDLRPMARGDDGEVVDAESVEEL